MLPALGPGSSAGQPNARLSPWPAGGSAAATPPAPWGHPGRVPKPSMAWAVPSMAVSPWRPSSSVALAAGRPSCRQGKGDAVTLGEAWEAHADDWIRWARTAEHDGFWDGTWPELEGVLPPPSEGLVVEVGCGEGRVGRKLLEQGRQVVGIELSATLSRAARTGDPPVSVVQADAAHLPLADAAAASVVACMSLLDVDDLTGTVAEAARILRPGGCLYVAIVHPFASAQDPDSLHTHQPTLS